MDTKNRILFQIDKDICEKNYKEALQTANQGFNCFKDNCFLDKAVRVHEKTKDYKSAVSVLKKMLKTEPNNKNLINRIAYDLFTDGNFKQALKYYNILLEDNKQVFAVK